MSEVAPVAAASAPTRVPVAFRRPRAAGPGDDEDETPIGDPPDDDDGDWDDDDDDDDDDDEDPLQATRILRRNIASRASSGHNGARNRATTPVSVPAIMKMRAAVQWLHG